MDAKTTFKTLLIWLNSCVTPEQIDLVADVSEKFLLDRFNASDEHSKILLAAQTKKDLPDTVVEFT